MTRFFDTDHEKGCVLFLLPVDLWCSFMMKIHEFRINALFHRPKEWVNSLFGSSPRSQIPEAGPRPLSDIRLRFSISMVSTTMGSNSKAVPFKNYYCTGEHRGARTCVQRSEDNFQELALSFPLRLQGSNSGCQDCRACSFTAWPEPLAHISRK